MTLPYIINVAVILLACLAFYKLLLRRETFYKVNRYMLITCLAISFALPLLQVPQQLSLRKPSIVSVESSVVSSETSTVKSETTKTAQPVTPVVKQDAESSDKGNNLAQSSSAKFSFAQFMNWLFWIYWFGVFIFAASFLFQLVLLLWRA